MSEKIAVPISSEKVLRSKGTERLKNLTHSAIELFLEYGYEATSMDMLINRVGGSRRNIYEKFGDKKGLFVTVISEECKNLSVPLEAIVLSNKCVEKTLHFFAKELLQIIKRPRTLELHRLMIAEGKRFPHLSQTIWMAGQDNAKLILATWIAKQQALGKFNSSFSAVLLAENFIQLVVSKIQVQMLISDISTTIEHDLDTIKNAVDFFLAATTLDIKNVKDEG